MQFVSPVVVLKGGGILWRSALVGVGGIVD